MILPDRVLKAMNASERKKLGKAGVTADEAAAKSTAKNEREIQADILQFCRLKGWPYDCPTFGKKTRVSIGRPDIIIALPGGKTAWVEVKMPKGLLSAEQATYLGRLGVLGHNIIVPTSAKEAIDWLKSLAE